MKGGENSQSQKKGRANGEYVYWLEGWGISERRIVKKKKRGEMERGEKGRENESEVVEEKEETKSGAGTELEEEISELTMGECYPYVLVTGVGWNAGNTTVP
ncbi:predicted protein [Histoplasma capsulatum H143]|uniref:Uncharacterized protein n=1 Tax=Ajellomyces capsulatus (strain H143) TaxID=544712 RepID=C6HJ16_AJECH|nr:predicted protein [Histoplasma capsulatum H143]